MARRISSGRSRGFSGSGSRASSRSSFRSGSGSSFRPGSSRHIGGYTYRSRPYRRDYFFHSLSPTGKVIYIIVMIILVIFLQFL